MKNLSVIIRPRNRQYFTLVAFCNQLFNYYSKGPKPTNIYPFIICIHLVLNQYVLEDLQKSHMGYPIVSQE